jgi:hypothetical protein
LAETEGEDDYCPLGEVPLEWVEKRMMGVAIVLAGHLERFGLDHLTLLFCR